MHMLHSRRSYWRPVTPTNRLRLKAREVRKKYLTAILKISVAEDFRDFAPPKQLSLDTAFLSSTKERLRVREEATGASDSSSVGKRSSSRARRPKITCGVDRTLRFAYYAILAKSAPCIMPLWVGCLYTYPRPLMPPDLSSELNSLKSLTTDNRGRFWGKLKT
jgi:hypothetical protein